MSAVFNLQLRWVRKMTTISDIRTEQFPFGAQFLPDGTTRFRLWMPQQEKLLEGKDAPRLALPNSKQVLPMEYIGEGWFELVVPAPHGTRYGFEIADPTKEGHPWELIPDPMSYWQEENVFGFSKVVDPNALDWGKEPQDWKGTDHENLIIYEIHVGTFTPEGTFTSAIEKLHYLQNLGVTAIELMPVGAVAAKYDWGYDEVLKSALHIPYGTPQELADLVQAAHQHGISIILDVVDNHIGPNGNLYKFHTPELWGFNSYEEASNYRTDPEKDTPWGAAIDLSRWEVRKFFAQKNAWLQKTYHVDGLRRDAVHELRDTLHDQDSLQPHYLEEIFREAVSLGVEQGRTTHVILEYEHNKPSLLFAHPQCQDKCTYGHAQWADDFHSVVRSLLFREDPARGFTDKGYNAPYNDNPMSVLSEVLSKGFALTLKTNRTVNVCQEDFDEPFDPRRSIVFTRNHDQVGNTPNGERIELLLKDDPFKEQKLAFDRTLLILNPMIPMLFMGQERALETPFPFIATWKDPDLKEQVQEGRKAEFPQFEDFTDPTSFETVKKSILPWPDDAEQDSAFRHFQELISFRKENITPHLASGVADTKVDRFGEFGLRVQWAFGDGASYAILMNAGNSPAALPPEDSLGKGQNGEIVQHEGYEPGCLLMPWEIKHIDTSHKFAPQYHFSQAGDLKLEPSIA